MAQVTFHEVAQLAERLTLEEQRALIEHLQSLARYRELTNEERKALLKASILDVPLNKDFKFSDRREDWYDDDGR